MLTGYSGVVESFRSNPLARMVLTIARATKTGKPFDEGVAKNKNKQMRAE